MAFDCSWKIENRKSTIYEPSSPDIVLPVSYSYMKMYSNPVHLLIFEPLDKITVIITSSSY